MTGFIVRGSHPPTPHPSQVKLNLGSGAVSIMQHAHEVVGESGALCLPLLDPQAHSPHGETGTDPGQYLESTRTLPNRHGHQKKREPYSREKPKETVSSGYYSLL